LLAPLPSGVTDVRLTGTVVTLSGSGPWSWSWSCAGSNGGTTAQCSAGSASESY